MTDRQRDWSHYWVNWVLRFGMACSVAALVGLLSGGPIALLGGWLSGDPGRLAGALVGAALFLVTSIAVWRQMPS